MKDFKKQVIKADLPEWDSPLVIEKDAPFLRKYKYTLYFNAEDFNFFPILKVKLVGYGTKETLWIEGGERRFYNYQSNEDKIKNAKAFLDDIVESIKREKFIKNPYQIWKETCLKHNFIEG